MKLFIVYAESRVFLVRAEDYQKAQYLIYEKFPWIKDEAHNVERLMYDGESGILLTRLN